LIKIQKTYAVKSISVVSTYWWSFGTKPLSLTVSEIFNGECDAIVDMTLYDLYKGQGRLFWSQSIPPGLTITHCCRALTFASVRHFCSYLH